MWKDTLKKSYFDKKRGHYKQADEIMYEKYGEEYRKATENMSPRHTKYGKEYMFYLRLMQMQKMTKEEAAKQEYIPKSAYQGPDDSETYF